MGSTIVNVATSVAVKSPRIYLQDVTPEYQSSSFCDCPVEALGGPSTATVWATLQVPCKAVAFCSEPLSFEPVQHIISQGQLVCACCKRKWSCGLLLNFQQGLTHMSPDDQAVYSAALSICPSSPF